MNQALEGKKFILGDTFTGADAYFFVLLTWAHHVQIDLAPLKNLTAYFAHVSQRPKVHAAMKAEGLVK